MLKQLPGETSRGVVLWRNSLPVTPSPKEGQTENAHRGGHLTIRRVVSRLLRTEAPGGRSAGRLAFRLGGRAQSNRRAWAWHHVALTAFLPQLAEDSGSNLVRPRPDGVDAEVP